MSYEEFERLRRLVAERADFHPDNWGQWRRRFRHGQGYGRSGSGFMGGGISSDFDDLCEDVDNASARIADTVIERLPLQHRLIISQVYEASVWRFRIGIDAVLVEAAAEFWRQAVRNGLI